MPALQDDLLDLQVVWQAYLRALLWQQDRGWQGDVHIVFAGQPQKGIEVIPAAAQRIIGNRTMPFDSDSLYAVDGVFMNELHALTLRLGTDQRMSSDEMRDWMNLLHLRLERAAPVYDLGKEA